LIHAILSRSDVENMTFPEASLLSRGFADFLRLLPRQGSFFRDALQKHCRKLGAAVPLPCRHLPV
jgi:hypothetical protein